MQDACTARRFRALLGGLAVPGSLLSVAAVPLAGWEAGALCYALAVTACLAVVMRGAGAEPAAMRARG